MPHIRPRQVQGAFEKLCAHSPIVGIFGHRQVGKTTFLESVAKDYISLDDFTEARAAQKNPKTFLRKLNGSLSAIDECQLAPALFPALKLRVQKQKNPGQFLLSGSVRFTSRKAIRESLTGRIATIELFPFILSEIRSDSLPDFLIRALEASGFSGFQVTTGLSGGERRSRQKDYEKYLEFGGLPGICFVREPQTQSRLLQDVIRTILDRDLRLIYETPLPYSDLIRLSNEIAEQPMSPIEISRLSRATGAAPRTIKHLINAMEAIFLLRRIPIEGGGSKGDLLWFEDQFEQNFLSKSRLSIETKRIGLAYRNARAQFEYRLGATPEYFHYRTRAGATIPIAIRTEAGVLGILPLASAENLTRIEKSAISSFLRAYNRSKVLVTTDKPEPNITVIDDRVLLAPVTYIY